MTSEVHMRNNVWNTVFLHWVFEGLRAIAGSIGIPTKKINFTRNSAEQEIDLNISLMDHDTMLVAIAYVANLITTKFTSITTERKDYVLSRLHSKYNSFVNLGGDINNDSLIGCLLTQWLLAEVEKFTILIPKKDVNAPQKKILRGRLRSVQCEVSGSAIKTIYSTDVLLDMVRKEYINPWGRIYGYDYNTGDLPNELQQYSVTTGNGDHEWAKGMDEKQISVGLKSNHLVRYSFHVFRRQFHGADPVAASKQMENTGVKMSKKRSKVEIKSLEKALTPKPVSVKQWLRNASTPGAATTPFSQPRPVRGYK